jgi:hypothetical protein
MKRALMVVSAAVVLAAPALSAQTTILVARADSLLMAGEVERAEALYYAVSRRSPRDPQGRAALGQYLASRGAFKIGGTLLEEALAFGGDTVTLARRRAPVLQAGDEWVDLAQLSHSPLSDAQRERARWLATHVPAVTGADSVTVAFEPSSVEGLGRVQLIVGSDTLAADIDPSSDELTLGDYTHFAKLVQVFSGEGGGRAGVLLRAKIGDIVLERMPAQFDPQLGPARARIGLTLLAKLAPTVDAAAGVLTLRRDGMVGEMTGRRRIPVVFAFPGVLVARPDRLVRIESPAGRALLATARWTLDLRRGELVLELDK